MGNLDNEGKQGYMCIVQKGVISVLHENLKNHIYMYMLLSGRLKQNIKIKKVTVFKGNKCKGIWNTKKIQGKFIIIT